MGRPRKVKPIFEAPKTKRTPFTVEVHGETIDLDLKLMLDPPDKSASKSLDQTLAEILKAFAQKLRGRETNEDPKDIESDFIKDVAEFSDIELSIPYRVVVAELRKRGMSSPPIDKSIDPDDEQPTSA